jgi:ribosomal protein S16
LVSSYDGDAIEKIGPYNTIKEACAECRLRNKGIKSKDFPRWMFADEGEIPFENKTKE